MKKKSILALILASSMVLSLAACGSKAETGTTDTAETAAGTEAEAGTESAEASGVPSSSQINIGTDYTDFTASIKWTTHRTDRGEDGTLDKLITEFNKVYPNIAVEVEAIPDFAEEALLRL